MPVVGVVGAGPCPPSPRMPVVEGAGSRVSHVLASRRGAPREPASAAPAVMGFAGGPAAAGPRASEAHPGPPTPWAETLPARAAMAAAD
eukprot:14515530-Alexandrium_andersonii.AAC.1